MKVKTIVKFRDIHTGAIHEIGEEFDCTDERFEEILKSGVFVEPVEVEPQVINRTLKEMTVAELKEYAALNGINIDGLTKKADILAAVTVAE